MKIKCTETFEYELELPDGLNDVQILKQIWKIRDTVDCVAGMSTPFWDGYPCPESIEETFKYEKNMKKYLVRFTTKSGDYDKEWVRARNEIEAGDILMHENWNIQSIDSVTEI